MRDEILIKPNLSKRLKGKNRSVRVTLHITAWLVLIIIPHFLINNYWGNIEFVPWSFYFNMFIYGLIFYINYIWLVPRFFLNKKKVMYFGSAIAVILVMYILNFYLQALERPRNFRDVVIEDINKRRGVREEFLPKPPDGQFERKEPFERREPPMKQLATYFFLLSSTIITGFSVGLKVIEQHGAIEKRQQELEREKLNSELAFLKNQISPHFFFNTLNNIYSLVALNSEDAQVAILKLSKLMRYLLYESESGKVNLADELNFMKHYIDLMQLRLSKKVVVTLEFPEDKIEHQIPPLLFIPFIENAFKHGVSYREKSFINVQMKIQNQKVFFSCSNSIGKTKSTEIDKNHSGIGLENVKKRLNLLFPGRYILNIDTISDAFMVSLEIDLK